MSDTYSKQIEFYKKPKFKVDDEVIVIKEPSPSGILSRRIFEFGVIVSIEHSQYSGVSPSYFVKFKDHSTRINEEELFAKEDKKEAKKKALSRIIDVMNDTMTQMTQCKMKLTSLKNEIKEIKNK